MKPKQTQTMADVSDERLDDAINALLNHQKQLDMDGVIVGVSRQALHEVVEALQARRAAEAKAVEALRELVRLYVDPMNVRPEHQYLVDECQSTRSPQ